MRTSQAASNKRGVTSKSTRFAGIKEDDEDFLIEDDYEGDDVIVQLDKMKKLDAERKGGNQKRSGGGFSAFTRGNLSSASTRIVDLTEDQISYGMRPSTAIQLQQIKALNEFNKALPKKKAKMALPMILSTNIGTTNIIKKDLKKKTVELLTKFNPVGYIDDHFYTPNEGGDLKYSLG